METVIYGRPQRPRSMLINGRAELPLCRECRRGNAAPPQPNLRQSPFATDDAQQKTEVVSRCCLSGLVGWDSLAPWGLYLIASQSESVNLAA